MPICVPALFRCAQFAFLFCLIVSSALLPQPARAQSGAAQQNVAVMETAGKAFGYSTFSGTWTQVNLETPAQACLAGDYLGYIRTLCRLYSFNSTNQAWYQCQFSGTPLGESAEGATTIFWSTRGAYAIASLWTLWRSCSFPVGEEPVGGGSCGQFALVWTPHTAYAFHSATGSWKPQELTEPVSGGITCEGLGLVWTSTSVYSFDPTTGSWVPLDLGHTSGVSVTGSGNVALAWASNTAEAYSGILDAWFPLDSGSGILEGVAQGELALLWSEDRAWVFDANTGLWSTIELPVPDPAGGGKPPLEFEEGFHARPNPSAGDRIEFRLPGRQEWEVGVFDVTGRQVRSFRQPRSPLASTLVWDRLDDAGSQVAAGTYWIRASCPDGIEARRIVLLP